MHDYRFFVDRENIYSHDLILVNEEFKHCCCVLRYGIGDKVTVFDGTGIVYKTEIMNVSKNQVQCKILEKTYQTTNNRLNVHLAVGLVKSKSLDLIIEQACSLGIFSFYPVETEHSIKKNFNYDRYIKKAIESIKQSGNTILPKINSIVSFNELIDKTKDIETKLICYQHSEIRMSQIEFCNIKKLLVFIGPEGGFSQNEINYSITNGFQSINIFDNRLRVELAVTTTLAGIHTLYRR